ncbi:hypothetical protein [Paraburkholderia sp. 2C]
MSVLIGGVFLAIAAGVTLPQLKAAIVQSAYALDQPLAIRIMVPVIWCIAIVVAVRNTYRGLAIRDIVVQLPRKLFMQLIYKRTYTAKTFFEVVVIELAVVAYSWWFAGAASDVANLVQQVTKSL